MYKVGDKVRIKKKEGEDVDYPCTYVESMSNYYAGKIATITQKREHWYSDRTRKFFNGDESQYKLDVDDGIYNWDSSIFESIDIEDITEDLKDELSSDDEFKIQSEEGFLIIGVPVIHNGYKKTIIRVDSNDNIQPYKFNDNVWIERDDTLIIDFLELFKTHKIVIFMSKIFGKMKISKQDNQEYPLLAELSDGDVLELTSDFKYFKDSISSII